jgi:hypothetical protein
MFRGHMDAAEGLAVWLFTPGPNTDDDWKSYCEAIRTGSRHTALHAAPCAFQVIEDGSEDPSAKWRGEIAASMKRVKSNTLVCLVTRSTMVRHILTAIFWVRPPRFTLDIVATETEGLQRLERQRPGLAAKATAILTDLRAIPARAVPG